MFNNASVLSSVSIFFVPTLNCHSAETDIKSEESAVASRLGRKELSANVRGDHWESEQLNGAQVRIRGYCCRSKGVKPNRNSPFPLERCECHFRQGPFLLFFCHRNKNSADLNISCSSESDWQVFKVIFSSLRRRRQKLISQSHPNLYSSHINIISFFPLRYHIT